MQKVMMSIGIRRMKKKWGRRVGNSIKYMIKYNI